MSATPRQVIFGTGAIGLATMEALRTTRQLVGIIYRLAGQPSTKLRTSRGKPG
jgi:hypothetical protein